MNLYSYFFDQIEWMGNVDDKIPVKFQFCIQTCFSIVNEILVYCRFPFTISH